MGAQDLDLHAHRKVTFMFPSSCEYRGISLLVLAPRVAPAPLKFRSVSIDSL
jgi:hypothetical protein